MKKGKRWGMVKQAERPKALGGAAVHPAAVEL